MWVNKPSCGPDDRFKQAIRFIGLPIVQIVSKIAKLFAGTCLRSIKTPVFFIFAA